MCLIDFGLPVEQDDDVQDSMARSLQNSLVKGKPKRRRNFEFFPFDHPVLFSAHLSKNSFLLIDKPWLEVVKGLEAPPVHRHIYGS